MQSILQGYAVSVVLGAAVVVLGGISVVQYFQTGAVNPEISRLLMVAIGLLSVHTNIGAVAAAKNTNGKNGDSSAEH